MACSPAQDATPDKVLPSTTILHPQLPTPTVRALPLSRPLAPARHACHAHHACAWPITLLAAPAGCRTPPTPPQTYASNPSSPIKDTAAASVGKIMPRVHRRNMRFRGEPRQLRAHAACCRYTLRCSSRGTAAQRQEGQGLQMGLGESTGCRRGRWSRPKSRRGGRRSGGTA